MSVSLDALLTAQKNKAQSVVARLDQAVSNDFGKRNEEFTKLFKGSAEPVQKEAQAFKEKAPFEAKKLDDYRQEANVEYAQAAQDIKDEYRAARSDVESVSKEVDGYSKNAKDAKQPEALVNAQGSKQEQTASEVEASIDAAKVVPDEAKVTEAGKRGVEAILNSAVTGDAEGEKIQTVGVDAGKILARGEKIIQSQQEAGALILNQQGGSTISASELSSSDGSVNQAEAQSNQNAQVVNLATILEVANTVDAKKVGVVTQPDVQSQPKSAVNVARQSKMIAQQLAAGEQVKNEASNPVVNTTGKQEAPVVAQVINQNMKAAEQMLAKFDIAKQMKQQSLQAQQNVAAAPAANAGEAAAVAANNANTSQRFMNNQQQNKSGDVALQKSGDVLLGDDSVDADGILSAKTSESAVKPEISQNVDGSKFKEYMKMVEVQGNARTQNTHGASKAEAAIAQIKFGVAAAAAKGDKQVTIQLYPKELGTVDVHMKISATKGAEITMVAERSETASLLQREAQNLKEALNDALKNQNTQLNFAFREGDGGQGKQGGSPFTMVGSDQRFIQGKEEEMIPLHQMQLGMEKGVDLVI